MKKEKINIGDVVIPNEEFFKCFQLFKFRAKVTKIKGSLIYLDREVSLTDTLNVKLLHKTYLDLDISSIRKKKLEKLKRYESNESNL